MEVKTFTYNDLFELCANTYLIIDEAKNCVIVDPGNEDENIIEYIKDNKLTLKGILLTHGHFDHIRGVSLLAKTFSVPIFMSQRDEELLYNPKLNCSDRFSRKNVVVKEKPTYVDENTQLNFLSSPIKVIETPFHTNGSICFYFEKENMLFSGDSLFFHSVGRMDFPTSCPRLYPYSLAKLMALKDETIVYPGHGDLTTIGEEKKQN